MRAWCVGVAAVRMSLLYTNVNTSTHALYTRLLRPFTLLTLTHTARFKVAGPKWHRSRVLHKKDHSCTSYAASGSM